MLRYDKFLVFGRISMNFKRIMVPNYGANFVAGRGGSSVLLKKKKKQRNALSVKVVILYIEFVVKLFSMISISCSGP